MFDAWVYGIRPSDLCWKYDCLVLSAWCWRCCQVMPVLQLVVLDGDVVCGWAMLPVSIHCPEATTPQGCDPEARSKAVDV